MPAVRQPTAKVIAIFVSDVHLSLRAPLARRAEPDWLAAQKRSLDELRKLANQQGAPIFYAGDIFDRWNSAPELINFALECLPPGYAVAGQHDAPYHRLDDLHRSAYWTLVRAGLIANLAEGEYRSTGGGLFVHGFPWGAELRACDRSVGSAYSKSKHIALVHRYCWVMGKVEVGMDKQADNATSIQRKLKGFDAICTGDNHRGFIHGNLCNTGTFFCRHADERNYLPFVGLLYSDNRIRPHHLDTSQDKWVDDMTTDKEQMVGSFTEFMQELNALEDEGMDFAAAVRRASRDMSSMGRQMILSALESAMETSK